MDNWKEWLGILAFVAFVVALVWSAPDIKVRTSCERTTNHSAWCACADGMWPCKELNINSEGRRIP